MEGFHYAITKTADHLSHARHNSITENSESIEECLQREKVEGQKDW